MPPGNYTFGRYTMTLSRPLERKRGGSSVAAPMRMVPRLYDYIVDVSYRLRMYLIARVGRVSYSEPSGVKRT